MLKIQLQLSGIKSSTDSYLPSTVFPTGLASNGLPVGLQAIGGPFQDHLTIEFTRQVADVLGGFVPPPGSRPQPRSRQPATANARIPQGARSQAARPARPDACRTSGNIAGTRRFAPTLESR